LSKAKVKTVSSAENALDSPEEETFDLIISNILLPHKTGIEMTEKLEKSGKIIPIIFISSFREELIKTENRNFASFKATFLKSLNGSVESFIATVKMS